jgi:hypothetical protein
MKLPHLVIAILALSGAISATAQYGYTPPVAPTPPTMPTMPAATYPTYPTYPASQSVPAAGAGMGYGDPNYGGYTPQPVPGGAPMGIAPIGRDLLSYGFLEGFYQYTDFDNSRLDPAHGFGLALSAELFKPLFVKGAFNWASSSGGALEKNGFDFSSVALGGGAYIPVTQRFHVLCELGMAYTKLDAKRSSLGFSDGSVYARPGVRFAATQKLELHGGVLLSSADDFDSLVIGVGAYWNMFSMLDLKLGADFGDESSAWKAGLRVRW